MYTIYNFSVFHQNLMKLGEVVVVVRIEYYNITKFFKNSDETQKSFKRMVRPLGAGELGLRIIMNLFWFLISYVAQFRASL